MSLKHYYIEQAKNPKFLNPDILYAGHASNISDWINISHKHSFCEILYVTKGRGVIILDGVSYPLSPGSLVIINPGVEHEEKSEPSDMIMMMFIAIKDFQITGMQENHLLPDGAAPVIYCGEHKKRIEQYFYFLLHEASSQIDLYQQVIQNLTGIILVLIMRFVCIAIDNEAEMSENCRKVKEYLDNNYSENITLDSLSETVYISKHHLSHMFKDQTGVPPIKYLTIKRIDHACALLADPKKSVAQVGREVGYENSLYFSQVFKKIKGMTPSQYRLINK